LYVSSLKLTNFRNFERAEFSFDRERTAIWADNARGKSNLLEALYFLALSKSGRGAKDRDVLHWGADYFAIEAQIVREDLEFPIRIAYDPRVGKKQTLVNHASLPRLSDLIGEFNAVLFSPEDVDLVLREPAQRRRILDILVSQSSSSYLSDLELYLRVLAQRNRLLKDRGSALLSRPEQMMPWNTQLAELGSRIVAHRLRALNDIELLLNAYYQEIAPTSEKLKAMYRSPVSYEDIDDGQAIIEKALVEKLPQEVELRYTLTGPHRDNLVFTLDNKAAHQFASKGQLKSVLLSWKLAEATFLEKQTGWRPVLLMDDIFSELDPKRSDALLAMIPSFGQVILTSARDPDLDFKARGFHILEL
jgi:DNA replication and repair protein RecF